MNKEEVEMLIKQMTETITELSNAVVRLNDRLVTVEEYLKE